MDNFLDIEAIVTNVVTYIILGGLGIIGWVFREKIFNFNKKPETDSNALLEMHKESLENAVKAKSLELELAEEKKDKERIQAELDELKNRESNPEKSLQETNILIKVLKKNLENWLKFVIELGGKETFVGKLTIAKADLEKGYFSKTDELLAEIEVDKRTSKENTINIAFTRGKIAEHEVRWHDAAEHYARAARLAPNCTNLMSAQKLAQAIGDYDSALSFSLDAQKAAITEYGKDSEEYSACLNNHGTIYQSKGQYEKARPFHEKSLRIRKKAIKKNTPEIAVTLNNLASVYRSAGQYKEAKKLFKEALDIQNEELAENHPDTANTANMLNNLAGLYSENGEHEKAEPLYHQALKIQRALFGEEHPNIALSLNNLSMFYCEEQKYDKAEPLCREAIKILEATLGPDHPQTKLFRENYEDLKKLQANTQKPHPNKNHT